MPLDISNTMSRQDIVDLANSLLADIAVVRTAVNVLATKLNADAGVTDINYAQVIALDTVI